MQAIKFSPQEIKWLASIAKRLEAMSDPVKEILKHALQPQAKQEPSQNWDRIRVGFTQVLQNQLILNTVDKKHFIHLLEIFFGLTVSNLNVLTDVTNTEIIISYELVKTLGEAIQHSKSINWHSVEKSSEAKIKADALFALQLQEQVLISGYL